VAGSYMMVTAPMFLVHGIQYLFLAGINPILFIFAMTVASVVAALLMAIGVAALISTK
jgi:hypothetical protein